MKGKIVKYVEEKGYGFILDENGNKRFFHITDTLNPLEIKEYQTVEFEPFENEKGLASKKVELINKNRPAFIKIYDTNIKCSNIKQFGISTGTETLFKKNKGILSGLFGNDHEEVVRFEDLPARHEIGEIYFGKDTTNYTQIEETFNYLYITTFQGDNYTWKDNLEELKKNLKYIEDSLN